jgi:hypothetical protein
MLDAAEKIVRITVAAAAARDETSLPTSALPTHEAVIFEGVRTDDVLQQRLEEALIVLLDAVQEGCTQGTIGSDVVWIDTTGGA